MADPAICSIPNCGKPAHTRGWCKRHYGRWYRNGSPTGGLRQTPGHGACSVDGCGRVGKLIRGWCSKHYQRWQDNGDPTISKIDRDQTGKLCKVEGCTNKSGFKGYCSFHGHRFKRTGDPLVASLNPRHRINLKWLEDHASYDGDDCLKWPFTVSDNGRGVITIDGHSTSVPNAMCRLAHGEPPTSQHEAAHSCGKGHEGCVNPNHLRWATRKENEADKVVHGTIRRGTKINTVKLTEDQVRDIRRRVNETGVALASEFGVTAANISSIRNRKNWAWLD